MSQPDFKTLTGDESNFPYDSWEQVYQQSALHELPWDAPEAHPLLIEIFKDHRPKPGTRALDLGCGTGASSRLLANVGYEVDALDVSETAIMRARVLSKGGGCSTRYIVGNAIKYALNSTSVYGLVLDCLFLHHVQEDDIDAYFNSVRNTLCVGGLYVVGVFVQVDDTIKRASYFSDGEVRYWTQSGIEQYLGACFVCDSAFYGLAGSVDHNYPAGFFMFTKQRE